MLAMADCVSPVHADHDGEVGQAAPRLVRSKRRWYAQQLLFVVPRKIPNLEQTQEFESQCFLLLKWESVGKLELSAGKDPSTQYSLPFSLLAQAYRRKKVG